MTPLAEATKDELVLTMLALLGGDHQAVNERDLFLASWHAFPHVMRWVDTPLPNPDTFTASLRRLDQKGLIERTGKQQRKGSKRRRKTALDPSRSGVVKAKLSEKAIAEGAVSEQLLEEVRGLVPPPSAVAGASDAELLAICVGLRDEMHVDVGSLVETAFHKFSSRFAFEARPEFPDTGLVRAAIEAATAQGLVSENLRLTGSGKEVVESWNTRIDVRPDESRNRHNSGDLLAASRIEKLDGFVAYRDNGSVVLSKNDELYRALRIPPTHDPVPVAEALSSRVRGLRKVDRGQEAEYLIAVAQHHNPDVWELASATNPELFVRSVSEEKGN